MTCECERAGFCQRHQVEKTEYWVSLCKTREDYFNAWESGRGPGQVQDTSEKDAKNRQVKQDRLTALRGLWNELHTYNPQVWDAKAAFAWFNAWLKRIPSFGCSCQEHFRAIVRERPPVFDSPDAFFLWGVARHNDVNRKLGKPQMKIEDARKLYGRE